MVLPIRVNAHKLALLLVVFVGHDVTAVLGDAVLASMAAPLHVRAHARAFANRASRVLIVILISCTGVMVLCTVQQRTVVVRDCKIEPCR